MSDDALPPMPDRHTGEPRPPKAPILKPSREPLQPWRRRKIPRPPKNEGPVLEWSYNDARTYRWTFAVTVVLLMLFMTARNLFNLPEPDWWFTNWWGWAIAVVGGLIMLLFGRGFRYSAGADWLMQRKEFLKTYELTSIKMEKDFDEGTLDLDDRHGNGMVVGLGFLRCLRQPDGCATPRVVRRAKDARGTSIW